MSYGLLEKDCAILSFGSHPLVLIEKCVRYSHPSPFNKSYRL
jgi:hypothetical protein